jgi:hypothetical protein
MADEYFMTTDVNFGAVIQRHQFAIHDLFKLAGRVHAQGGLKLRDHPFAGLNLNGSVVDGDWHFMAVLFTIGLRLLDFLH